MISHVVVNPTTTSVPFRHYSYNHLIKVREYRRGNQKWTIQRNWQHWVHKTGITSYNNDECASLYHACWRGYFSVFDIYIYLFYDVLYTFKVAMMLGSKILFLIHIILLFLMDLCLYYRMISRREDVRAQRNGITRHLSLKSMYQARNVRAHMVIDFVYIYILTYYLDKTTLLYKQTNSRKTGRVICLSDLDNILAYYLNKTTLILLLYWVSNCPGNMPKYYPGNMPKYYSTKISLQKLTRSIIMECSTATTVWYFFFISYFITCQFYSTIFKNYLFVLEYLT